MKHHQNDSKPRQRGWAGRRAVEHGLSDNYIIWRILGREQEYTLAKRSHWTLSKRRGVGFTVLKFGKSVEELERSVRA